MCTMYICIYVSWTMCTFINDLLSIHVEHHSIGLRIGRYLIFHHVFEQHLCLESVTLLTTAEESDIMLK